MSKKTKGKYEDIGYVFTLEDVGNMLVSILALMKNHTEVDVFSGAAYDGEIAIEDCSDLLFITIKGLTVDDNGNLVVSENAVDKVAK
ncbi:MAG: hypothetical protein CUN56_08885 [Phototrophicales bacterium]|nr:MAG: hypothetical protein CUN56_08885 [Phototrophicales bacterium]